MQLFGNHNNRTLFGDITAEVNGDVQDDDFDYVDYTDEEDSNDEKENEVSGRSLLIDHDHKQQMLPSDVLENRSALGDRTAEVNGDVQEDDFECVDYTDEEDSDDERANKVSVGKAADWSQQISPFVAKCLNKSTRLSVPRELGDQTY